MERRPVRPAWLAAAGLVAALAAPAAAQTAPPPPAASPSPAEPGPSRYQIGMMERLLEGAVEHGAKNTRDRLQAVVPATMLISDNARVRGFRLDGYGVFFDVEVPSLESTPFWSFRTLDQNDLGLQNALKTLKAHVDAAGDVDLQQALERVELQIGPVQMPADASRPAASASTGVGVRAAAPTARPPPPGGGSAGAPAVASDSILKDPENAYRTEVKQALMDAMLDYSGPLGIRAGEWLTVAARRTDERPRLSPADTDAQTIVVRVSGADLNAFRAGTLSREEALRRMNVQVF
jgi:hypothetical protein